MSKLGWQFQSIPAWADGVVNSEYVKVIDPPLLPIFQNRKTVGRVYIPDDATNAMIWRGAAGAREWFAQVAPVMAARRWVWAWELPNEPQPVASWDFCNALAAFTIEAAGLMRNAGFRSIGGNLAEGNPGGASDTERANLFCAVARGLSACDYWSQHAYWVPDGYPHPEAGYNRWHALRYQMNRGYAKARGIYLPPVLLTEGGYDYGIVGRPKVGWRSQVSWESYLRDLRRFDADLCADPDVLGCQLFVTGANGDWADFEIGEPESRALAAHIGAPVVTEPQPPPIPAPVVTTELLSIGRPLARGIGRVSQVFGVNAARYAPYGFEGGHEGLDYACPVGSRALACAPGVVLHAGPGNGANAAYGNYVVLDHGKFRSWYCHLLDWTVEAGAQVAQGAQVGFTGNTGRSTGAHLHFGIQIEGAQNGSKGFIDPYGLRVLLGDA